MTKYMNQWINKTKKAYSFIETKYVINKYTELVSKEEIDRLLKEFQDTKYTLEQIPEYLLGCKQKYIYSFGQLRIHVLCRRMTKKIEKQVRLSLYRGNAIYKLFNVDVKKKFNKKFIDIVLLPIHKPRQKPSIGEKIEPAHVNGGYTYLSDHTIYIYRLEEWPKVVLHELLHNVPSLQNIAWKQENIEKLYRDFHIDTSGCPAACHTVLEPTEAIVETWAIFLHTVFMSLESSSKGFVKLLEEEIKWNDKHIAWILKKRDENHDGIWREDTHIFSYIVLRGILLHHLEQFLKMAKNLPYQSDNLAFLFETGWHNIQPYIHHNSAKTKDKSKHNSLRMSKFGDY